MFGVVGEWDVQESAKDPVAFVQGLLELRDKYDTIVNDAFRGEKRSQKRLKEARCIDIYIYIHIYINILYYTNVVHTLVDGFQPNRRRILLIRLHELQVCVCRGGGGGGLFNKLRVIAPCHPIKYYCCSHSTPLYSHCSS